MNIEMDEKLKFAKVYGLEKNGFSELKPNQAEIIQPYLSGYDVLFCSPTESGSKYHYKRAIISPPAKRHLNGISLVCW